MILNKLISSSIKTISKTIPKTIKFNQIRTLKTIQVNDVKETIIERCDYPLSKCKSIIGDKTIGIIGYGPQGRGQSLNLKDNGFNVKIGVRRGASYDKALENGWIVKNTRYIISK